MNAGTESKHPERTDDVRVLIAAHYASDFISGESAIPLHLLRRLRARGVEAWLLTHSSFRSELAGLAEREPGRVLFSGGLPGGAALLRMGERLPDGPRDVAWGLTQLERQMAMVSDVRDIVRRHRVSVVHQPVGVAPSVPSPFMRLGAPLVVGPLNGGMSLPEPFRGRESLLTRTARAGRGPVTKLGNRLIPGRLRADMVLVANERTRQLLPSGIRGEIRQLPEIGVVLSDWPMRERPSQSGPLRVVFVGRLVALKSLDLLIEALSLVPPDVPVSLDVLGEGPLRAELQAQVDRQRPRPAVRFHGWLPQREAAAVMRSSDVLVLPSLRESGGAVLLEAMASGLPVIAADWGGPASLVPAGAGVLVPVETRDGFVRGLASAVTLLAKDPGLCDRLGACGRSHVAQHHDWDVLTDQIVDIYRYVGRRPASPACG